MNSRRAKRDAKFWARLAKKYAAAPIEDMVGYEATLKAVSERLSVDHDVLEIGCGTGTTALRLAHMVRNYLATDPWHCQKKRVGKGLSPRSRDGS